MSQLNSSEFATGADPSQATPEQQKRLQKAMAMMPAIIGEALSSDNITKMISGLNSKEITTEQLTNVLLNTITTSIIDNLGLKDSEAEQAKQAMTLHLRKQFVPMITPLLSTLKTQLEEEPLSESKIDQLQEYLSDRSQKPNKSLLTQLLTEPGTLGVNDESNKASQTPAQKEIDHKDEDTVDEQSTPEEKNDNKEEDTTKQQTVSVSRAVVTGNILIGILTGGIVHLFYYICSLFSKLFTGKWLAKDPISFFAQKPGSAKAVDSEAQPLLAVKVTVS